MKHLNYQLDKRKTRSRLTLLPRLLRFRDAPGYLGMDRNRFNAEVRPFITRIPIGRQGVAFDRLELDAWVDEYVACNGRPGRLQGERLWDEKRRQASTKGQAIGISTSGSKGSEFAKALAQLNLPKQHDFSQD
ncbi:MAG: hypothetical protein AB8B96_13220 [Lysobacterales bacterium]